MAKRCPVLPDEVTEDIFARLPAKAVHRFRCLSRPWAATLASDDFADLHLRLANRDGGLRILLLQDSRSPDVPAKVQARSPANPGGTLVQLPASHEVQGGATNNLVPRLVTQQCRGLVILEAVAAPSRHYVLNPSTGRMAALPESQAMNSLSSTCLGLGYDRRTRKHKVVRIYYRGYGGKKESTGCEVYVINPVAVGLWRPAEGCARPLGSVYKEKASVFVQGHVHWLAVRKSKTTLGLETFAVSFSMDNERLGAVPLPPLALEKSNQHHNLADFHGRLCLFCSEFVSSNSGPVHDIWLFHGRETSAWDLHCRVDLGTLPPKVTKFASQLVITNNGGRIIFVKQHLTSSQDPSFQVFSYDLVTDNMENLLDNNIVGLKGAASYDESIASPGQPLATLYLVRVKTIEKK